MPDVLGRIATPSPWEDYVPTKEDAKALIAKLLLGGKPTQIPGPAWMSSLHNAIDPEQSLGGVAGAAMMAVPGEAGALGSFKSTLPETVVGKTLEGGGYSVNLPTGMTPMSGLMVGKYANADARNTVVPNVEFGTPSVEAHVAKNAKVLGSDENYLGNQKAIKARIRQITYDRGLTRKALGDPNHTNPQYEAELSLLRRKVKNQDSIK